MDCREVRDWLLRSDLAEGESSPAGVSSHLDGCPACRSVAGRLRRLEQAVREMPDPEGAEAAREAFLQRLPAPGAVRRPGRDRILRRVAGWGAAAAAAMLLAAGAALFLMDAGDAQRAEASDVLDQLVDWNLEMTGAGSTADRSRLYESRAGELERRVRGGALAAPERELASSLLENGVRLIRTVDPLSEAEGFTDVSAVVVRQMGDAAARGDAKRAKRLNTYYAHLMQRGVNAKLSRLDASAPRSPEHERALEKLLRRHAALRDQLTGMLEASPAATREEIRRALDVPHPKRRREK